MRKRKSSGFLEGCLVAGLMATGCVPEKLPRYFHDNFLTYKAENERYLSEEGREGEHVLPDDIYNLYADLACGGTEGERVKGTLGLYVAGNRLSGRRDEFFRAAREMGYDAGTVEEFYGVLTKRGIAYKESALEGSYFRDMVIHERMHRAVDSLPPLERACMYAAYYALRSRPSPEGGGPFFRSGDKGDPAGDIVNARPDEFFPYLAGKRLARYVKPALEKDFPEAWNIFERLLEGVGHREGPAPASGARGREEQPARAMASY
jgi:hypothetical protein